MVFGSILKKRGYGFWVVVIVSVFSLVFSGVSIYSAYELSAGLHILVKHPIKVSASIYNVRTAVSEMEIRMRRLTNYNSLADTQIVRKSMNSLNPAIDENMKYIINYYLGPKEETHFIKENLDKLTLEQERILKLAPNCTPAEVTEYIESDLAPLYKAIDETFTKKLLVFIDGTGSRLSSSAYSTLKTNILFSILISLMMISIAFISQRIVYKRIEEKKHRDDILKIISESAGNVFLLYNLERQVMEYVSPNVTTIIGAEVKSLEKKPRILLDYCAKEHLGNLDLLFASDIIRTPISDECLFKNASIAEERWMLSSVYPVLDKGHVTRYIISLSDLTEVKKNQQVLRDALVNAQNANKAKSEFFSRMSHDIRTPMNAIIGMSTIAAAVLDDKSRLEDCLAKIASSSRHLLMLINDVLDMSKIESGKLAIANTPFGFAEIIKDVTSIIYPQARAKGLTFDLSTNVTHEVLIGDPLRVNQVLLNILSNAIKFTPSGGNIRMQIKERTERFSKRVWLDFTISDTGVGMNPDFLDRIFLPFEQEHSSLLHVSPGTGLGMAITKNIIALMNGSISVQSILGQGTTFKIGIGFDLDPAATQAVEHEFEDLKVLVVDDDKDTCEHTTLILSRMGVQAEWVLSGAEAVSRVFAAYERSDCYDVAFIDWRMPDMDGIEVTKRIRRMVGPDTLIIIISAYDWTEIEQEAQQAGVNAFIPKPMFQSTIYNTLRTVTKGLPSEYQDENVPPNFTGKRFLLVEDNELNSEIAVEFLQRTGAEVDTVDNGEKAVWQFLQSSSGFYSAILMDVQMPIMDGYQATRAIRKLDHPDATNIPILAMTANAFADDVAMAIQSGMNDHIGKPIDIALLFQKLKNSQGEQVA